MAGFEVEFIDPELPHAHPADPAQPVPAVEHSPGGMRRLAWAAVALLVVAAALCLIAPVQRMFTFRFDGPVITSNGGLDGWGRQLAITPGAATRTTQHGPRFGIVLVICAGLLGLLAAAIARGERTDADPRSRSDRWLRAVPLAGVVGVGSALAGVVASIALTIESQYATYRDVYIALIGDGAGKLALSTGACIWLALAAVVCTFAAAVVLVVLHRQSDPHRGAGVERRSSAGAQAANPAYEVPGPQDGGMMGPA